MAEQKAKTQAQGLEAKSDEAKKLNAPKNFNQNLQQAQALAASAEADRLRAEKKVIQGKVNLITANVKSKKEEIAQLKIKSKGDNAKGNAAAVKAAEKKIEALEKEVQKHEAEKGEAQKKEQELAKQQKNRRGCCKRLQGL